MPTLLERMRAARETWVQVQGYALLVRRPTALELAEIGGDLRRLLRTAVVGWQMRELDLVPGGDGQPAPFDADALAEWVADKPTLLNELLERIHEINRAYLESLPELEKK